MSTVVTTIGSGKDYATPQLWEADFDYSDLYSSGDIADGKADAGNYAGQLLLNGGGVVGLGGFIFEPADGEYHDGTRGTGPIINHNDVGAAAISIFRDMTAVIRFIEVDGGYRGISASGGQSTDKRILNNLIYGDYSSGGLRCIELSTNTGTTYVENNMMFDYNSGAISTNYGIWSRAATSKVMNNTFFGLTVTDDASSVFYGYYMDDASANILVENNICLGLDAGAGTTVDFRFLGSNVHDYNMSDDTTATGGNSLINQTASNEFVSVTVGSEDLHLKSTANAIGEGDDLSSEDSGYVDIDIDDNVRIGTWDMGADMFAVNATIGTDSRNFSTITLFEAAFSGWTDAPVTGNCYNDSAFDESVLFNNASPNSFKISVAEGERHDGTAGTGARVVRTSSSNYIFQPACNPTGGQIYEWLELDHNGNQTENGAAIIQTTAVDTGDRTKQLYRNLLIHGCYKTGARFNHGINAGTRPMSVYNTIVYHVGNNESVSGSSSTYGIGGDDKMDVYNCVVANVKHISAGSCLGLSVAGAGIGNVKNCIVMDVSGSTGTNQDYNGSGSGYASFLTSISEDATGTSGLTSKTYVDQFVSTSVGTEDYHLKAGSDAIDVGTDLGSTLDVNIDIDGFDRDAGGVTWDIGAAEYGVALSIGATARDFATFTLFEAALGSYTNKAVEGQAYDDAAFDESVTWNDTNPASLLVRPASGEMHDGTAGTGVRIVASTDRVWNTRRDLITINGIEFDLNGHGSVSVISNAGNTHGNEVYLCCLLIHDVSAGAGGLKVINGTGRDVNVHDCVVYDLLVSGTGSPIYAIFNDADFSWAGIRNNTVYRVRQTTSGGAYGILTADLSNGFVKNNIVIGCSGVGGNADFSPASPSNADMDYNASSDSSASGSNSVTGQTTAVFVSVTDGSEDLHLVDTATDLIDAGINLGSDYATDASGYDRSAYTPERWSIGAFIGPKEIEKKVGTVHADEDYATLALWDADFGDSTIYYPGDSPTALVSAELYTGKVTLSDVTIPFKTVTVKPRTGDEFNGTLGSGPHFYANLLRLFQVGSFDAETDVIIRGMEVKATGTSANEIFYASGTFSSVKFDRCIAWNVNNAGIAIGIRLRGHYTYAENCLVFDINSSGSDAYGISSGETSYIAHMYDCTVDNITASGNAYCYEYIDSANQTIKGCIGTNAGTAAFEISSPSNADVDYCCSDDASAPGSNSLPNTDPLYEGAPNYALQTASPCADTNGSFASVDILGVSRPQGLGPSMGCFEQGFIAPTGGYDTQNFYNFNTFYWVNRW